MSQPEILRWDQAYNRNGDGKLPRAVVNVIRTYMDNDSLAGWVSQETLARDTGLDESNVRRQIRKNAEAGWLVVTKRGRAGRASEYRLTYPQPGEYARLESTVSNQANMPGYTPQPGEYARLQPGEYARPTSPRASPQEKLFIRDPFEADPLGQPLSVEGMTEATEVADGRGRGGPSFMSEPASAGSSAEPEKARLSEDWSQYEPPDEIDMSRKAQAIRAHVPMWRR